MYTEIWVLLFALTFLAGTFAGANLADPITEVFGNISAVVVMAAMLSGLYAIGYGLWRAWGS